MTMISTWLQQEETDDTVPLPLHVFFSICAARYAAAPPLQEPESEQDTELLYTEG